MNNLMEVVTRPIYLEMDNEDISKRNCYIAIIFFVSQLIYLCIALKVLKHTYIYDSLVTNTSNSYERFIFGAILSMPVIIVLFIILKLTNQKISIVGLRKKGMKSSFIIALIVSVAICINKSFSFSKINMDLLYNFIFYMLFIGFYEELIFRGYMWPVLQKISGKYWGIIICGALFGLQHAPFAIIWKNNSVFDVIILGKGTPVTIVGGIIGQLMFGYIYTRNKNILSSTFVHGLLDFSSIL